MAERPAPPVHLLNAAPEERVATILRGVYGLFETVFPDRVRALYLLGSRGDGTAASVSDIDGVLVFRARFVADERERAQHVLESCRLMSPLRLDLGLLAEDDEEFHSGPDVRLALGATLVLGDDVRDRIRLPDLERYRRYIVGWPDEFIRILHDMAPDAPLDAPLGFPDPGDEHRGYTRVRAPRWYPADTEAGSKELVATICWTATALLALDARSFAGNRAEAVRLYAAHARGSASVARFGTLVERAYHCCKGEWDYRVPEDPAARAQLREICDGALAFFEHYRLRSAAFREARGVNGEDR